VIHLNGLRCTVFHSFSEVVRSFFCRMFCWQQSKKNISWTTTPTAHISVLETLSGTPYMQ